MNILIIDDEPQITQMLKDYLSAKGHYVDIAASGKRGLNLLEARRFDFVFCDFNMPEMNGIELTQFVKKNYPDTKVIMLSGYETMKDFLAASVGADDYVSKPFGMRDIEAILTKH